jgi:hypothetical protein
MKIARFNTIGGQFDAIGSRFEAEFLGLNGTTPLES